MTASGPVRRAWLGAGICRNARWAATNMARPAQGVRAYVNFRVRIPPKLAQPILFCLVFPLLFQPFKSRAFFPLIGPALRGRAEVFFCPQPARIGPPLAFPPSLRGAFAKDADSVDFAARTLHNEDYGGRFAFGGIVFPLRASRPRFCCARTNRPDRTISLRRNSALSARSEWEGLRRFPRAMAPTPEGNRLRPRVRGGIFRSEPFGI